MPLTDGSNALVDPTHVAAEALPIFDLDPDATALGTVYRVPVVDPATGASYGTVIRTEHEVASAVNPTAVLTATPAEVTARRRTWDRYRTILTGWPANLWGTNTTSSMAYWPTYTAATTTNTPITVQLGANAAQATTILTNLTTAFQNYATTTYQAARSMEQLVNAWPMIATGPTIATTVVGAREATEADRRRWARQKRQRARAAVRARELLAEHLTPEESAQLAADGYFVVTGESGRRYRIYRGYSRNIVELDRLGRPIARLCAHPTSALPDEDHMLAQRVYLQAAEADFRRIANISRIYEVEADLLLGGAERAAADGAETTEDYQDDAERRHLAA